MDQFFHEIFNGHKPETMGCMELKICVSDKDHRYYKHINFHENLRSDPIFLVDLTWNDPYMYNSMHKVPPDRYNPFECNLM